MEGERKTTCADKILPKILDYLDIHSLKESRLACSFWGFEGGKILMKKSSIKLEPFAGNYDGKALEKNGQLGNFLNTAGDSATFNATITNMAQPDTLKNILPPILQQIDFLSLNSFNFHEDHTRLLQFLEFFPNLQILRLGDKWANILEDFSAETKTSLVEKFESLKEIRLNFRELQSHHLRNLLVTMKNELAVKEIHLHWGDDSSFFEKYLEFERNWPIDTLVLELGSFEPQLLNNVRVFLEKISGSLKHLRWNLTVPLPLSAEYLVPWAKNFTNPSALNRLETLKIEGRGGISCDFSWLLFTLALQLPNLKKLTVNKVPANLEDKIREWNDHPAAAGRCLKSESLEQLVISRSIHQNIGAKSMIIFSRRLWPNLKSLCLQHPQDHFPTSFLLSEWIGLERLDLEFKNMSQESALCWTRWLTGGNKSKDANPDGSPFTLKDLKNLRHLGLWEDDNTNSDRIATDFVAGSSLKFMTQLQSLHLANSKISGEVETILKETLGPRVNVEFQSGPVFKFRCRRYKVRMRNEADESVPLCCFLRFCFRTHFHQNLPFYSNLIVVCVVYIFWLIFSYFLGLLLSFLVP